MKLPSHITAFIHATPTGNPDQPYNFAAWGVDMTSCGYVPIARAEIPMPEITLEEIGTSHLTLLRLKREEVYEEARKKAAELDEQIARLECLSYTPTQENSL